jgi:hypothetical protein
MPAQTELLKSFAECLKALDNASVVSFQTDPTALAPLYRKLPARFPKLFEQFLINYRWTEAHFSQLSLLDNPAGDGLQDFEHNMLRDHGLVEILLPEGFIPFGRQDDVNYDPVCFDTKKHDSNGDYPVVRLDHEAALIHFKVKVVSVIAPSFHELVWAIIDDHKRLRA